MTCCKCGCGPMIGALYRLNEKGEKAVWGCLVCFPEANKHFDPLTNEVIGTIEAANTKVFQ